MQIDADDYNLDARKEIRIAGDRLVAFLAPSRGGHLYELDVRGRATQSARHAQPAARGVSRSRPPRRRHSQHDQNSVASIHDAVRFKQPDLDRKLVYDNWPRKSLVDHFLPPNIDPAAFRNGEGEIGDFVLGVYETKLRRSPGRVEAVLARDGVVGAHRMRSRKVDRTRGVGRRPARTSATNCRICRPASGSISPSNSTSPAWPPARPTATSTTAAAGSSAGSNRSSTSSRAERIGLVDEWLGIDVAHRTVAADRHLDVPHSDGEPVGRGLRAGAPIECRGAALGFPGRTGRALSAWSCR